MLPAVSSSTHASHCPSCRMPCVRFGSFFRSSDKAIVQRYRCKRCHKTHSDATASDCFNQKKRHVNGLIAKLITGGYSQRRIAFDFNLNRKTVVRKFLLMGNAAMSSLRLWNLREPKVTIMQFDDMETAIHSKCKPASITLAVEKGTRRILGFRVAQMPAKGKLAVIARKKYGYREDKRPQARTELFNELKDIVTETAIIWSDKNPHYPPDVKAHFPKATYKTTKGRRGCVVGQGELKRGGFDPIFSLNHSCAMLRANMNRLFRRTWCTTKKIECLRLHIALYALNHNLRLLPATKNKSATARSL